MGKTQAVYQSDSKIVSPCEHIVSGSMRKPSRSTNYQSLTLAQQLYSQGEKDAGRIRQAMIDLIKKQPLAEKIDYVSIADAETMEELDEVKPPALVSLAVKIGKPRLIDNIVLE